MANEDACVTCGEEGKEEDEALQCDLCKVWEHLRCIKVCDRPSHECYSVLIQSVSKVLLFVCTKCRCKGTLARWLLHAELALESAQYRKGCMNSCWRKSTSRFTS